MSYTFVAVVVMLAFLLHSPVTGNEYVVSHPYFPRGHFIPVPKVVVLERHNSSFFVTCYVLHNCKQYGLTNKMNE